MSQPLFHVVALNHAADLTAASRVNALQRAFEIIRPEVEATQFTAESDPWSFVNFTAYGDPTEFEKQMPVIGKRALFVILVTEKMADDSAWKPALDILASALPKKAEAETRNALCFASSEEAQSRLPGRLRERQAPESSMLGERRLRPHTLALLALHPCPAAAGHGTEQEQADLVHQPCQGRRAVPGPLAPIPDRRCAGIDEVVRRG